MIQGGNLLFEIPDSKQLIFNMIKWGKLVTPDELIFVMIKGEAGVDGINDLIHWSHRDLFTHFLPFMCEIKAASSILATLTSFQQ